MDFLRRPALYAHRTTDLNVHRGAIVMSERISRKNMCRYPMKLNGLRRIVPVVPKEKQVTGHPLREVWPVGMDEGKRGGDDSEHLYKRNSHIESENSLV